MSYAFRNNATGAYPVTPDQIRFAHRANVSFGPTIDEDVAESLGYAKVEIDTLPVFDPATHVAEAVLPQFIDGVWRQAWVVRALSVEELAARDAQALAAAKAARTALVAAIKVTTAAGNTFDGDEDSQNRMARAIAGMTDTDELPWILANNTPIMATQAELREALRLSGLAMAAIWMAPYQ